jgi:hypothetical protein
MTAADECKPGDPFHADRTPIQWILDGPSGLTALYEDGTRSLYPKVCRSREPTDWRTPVFNSWTVAPH